MDKFVPFIALEILDTALNQLEDAEYKGMARVVIGLDMVLVSKEEFEELKAFINKSQDTREFCDIVPSSNKKNKL